MRNLKRALSLTLASVMLLGMMVIGTSAAAGYDDVKETDNVEAIEVLQAVEVMVGDDRGFGPDRPVTRAEMAVVMGKLLNLDYNYYVSTCPFADVSGNYEWARGWVGACAANGIVSGRGEGIYDPAATVTAVEAASMMMRALGYFKHVDDYADGFQVVTVRQGSQIGIFNGVGTNATNPMTRNQVAQMALNALRSEMVDFTGTLSVEINGVKVGYRAEYTSRTSTEAKYNAIEGRTSDVASDANHKGQYYVQLGEELYDGKLRLNNGATDAFGRPSRHWEYDGKAIGTYVKKELMDKEWVGEVTGKDLYDQLGKATLEDKSYDFFIYVDGEDRYSATDGTAGVSTVFNKTQMNKNNKAAVGGTGTGVLTQVFVDVDNHDVTIAVINTYLARAKADYNEKRDELSLYVYAIEKGTANNTTYYWKNLDRDNDQKETIPVSDEDFPVAGAKENDSFLVTVAEGEIQSMVAPEVIASTTLDSFKRNNNVVAEGTTYKYTTTAQYDVEVLDDYTGDSNYGVNLKDKHYNIYLDAYDNLIGIDLVENADNYVFITGVDSSTSNLAAKRYDANAIFLDGTMKTITFDNEKSDLTTTTHKQGSADDWALANTWCTYTVSGDIYTLKQVANPKADGTSLVGTKVNNRDIKVGQYYDNVTQKIDVKNVSLRGAASSNFQYVYGNDETVYLNAEVKGIYTGAANTDPRGVISKVSSVTTGIKNAGLEIMAQANAITQAQKNSGSKNVPVGNGQVAYGSYVLYNNKGYVIAAVTVADDASASENLVYVHTSSVDLERYTPADDEWTWQRRVVNNGEEVTLTEVGDGISVLKGMQEHNWYVVAYNAKGNVISASHAVDELASKTTTQHEDDINSLPATINAPGVNTVLYEKSEYNGYTTPSTCPDNSGASHTANEHKNSYGPKLVANTFYDITTATTGFYVADDVKVVFIQKNKNVTETHFLSGKTDLENAIEDLITTDTDNCGKIYHYEVSAVLENGIAKTVILHDLHVQGDGGSHVTPPQDYNPIVTQNGLVLEVKANTNDGQSILVFSAVQDWLSDNGYELVSIAKNASSGYDVVAKKGGSTFMFATSLTKMSKITVNGAVGYYAEGATITATNYILGATEAAVAPGVVVATPTTGSVTVAYTTHNGKFIRTDVKQFSVDSTANMCYRVGDMITGLTGNWYTADSGATYQPVTSAGVEVTATLGTTITSGYYKVTQKVASPGPDKVAYVTAGSTTTGLTLAGPWAKDTTGTMHKVTTNQINMLAAANARDITIANGEDAYAEVKLTSNAAATAVDGITAVVTPAPDAPQYAKAGQTVTFTVTLTGTAADASDAAVTVTLANAKWQATITGITGVTRTSDTVVTIADDTDLGTGITLEVTADVATTPADIAATLTVA